MAWVRFKADFDWKPKLSVTIGYKAGIAARVQARLGGEEVVASRLAGVQPLILTVRSSSQTRQVTSGWRAYDARAGINADGEPKRLFNIRSSANVDERNAFIDFLVSEGQPG
jgi:head-tail adaptor